MYTPIRNHSNAFGNNRWFGYSPKLKRHVWTYSDLEYEHWVLVEMNPHVQLFCEQPRRITQGDHDSIFDMWMQYDDGIESFTEVKYSYELDPTHAMASERSIRQVEIQREWCQRNGFKYEVQTELTIQQNPIFLDNMKLMLPYLREHNAPVETDCFRLIQVLDETPISLQLVSQTLLDMSQSKIIEAIAWLYVKGQLQGTFENIPIGANTEVWKIGKTENP